MIKQMLGIWLLFVVVAIFRNWGTPGSMVAQILIFGIVCVAAAGITSLLNLGNGHD